MWHRDPLTQFVAPGDRSFWDTVWESDFFRAALDDPNDPYGRVIAWAQARPWWFVALRQPHERYHFGAWFAQTLGQRTYENPLIHDLYLFHEMLHAHTFVDDPTSSDGDWQRRMRADEIAVSLETEVLVYARHPDWRPHSFASEIWADRFDLTPAAAGEAGGTLGRRANKERRMWQARPQGRQWRLPFVPTRAFDTPVALWERRRLAAVSPIPNDPVEGLIASYDEQADLFFDAWRPFWRQVERDRIEFENLCAQGRWQEAVRRRERRWEQVSDADGIPYGEVARASFVP